MRKVNYDIQARTAEELRKLGKSAREIADAMGCSPSHVRNWLNEDATISAWYLAKMHELGCDVIYVLTGEADNG